MRMFDRSRRRRAPFVFYLAAGTAGVGTGELLGWILLPDRRGQHAEFAFALGLAVTGAAFLILVGLLQLRRRRSP